MKKNWYIIMMFVLVLITLSLFGVVGVYASTSYHETDEAKTYLVSDDYVEVNDCGSYISFTPKNVEATKGVIFYPGGLVDCEAYSALINKLAHEGLKCYIVRMPYQLAFFKYKACDDIRNENPNISFYLVGHSLGGVSLSLADTSNYSGVVFLASYSTNEIQPPVLLIKGSNDGVLKGAGYEDSKVNYSRFDEKIIEGGNHAGFAMYGNQRKDNQADITNLEQIELTKAYILEFINKN